ncbi:MAG: dTMP kinase [bacterium]
MLICFTGIDGSGKTTQAQRLFEKLKELNIDCEYSWSRWEPFLLKPFISFFRKKAGQGTDKNNPEAVYSLLKDIKRKLFKHKFILQFYQYAALVDYYVQVRKKIIAPLKQGKTVICDRYIYDLFVDWAINSGYSEAAFARLLQRRFPAYFPKPVFVFLLDVPPYVGGRRKNDGTATSYLEERRGFYRLLTEYAGAKIIDGMNSMDFISEVVLSEVEEMVLNKDKT